MLRQRDRWQELMKEEKVPPKKQGLTTKHLLYGAERWLADFWMF